MRLEGEGMDAVPDLGLADRLPSGLTAAELVCAVAPNLDARGKAAARNSSLNRLIAHNDVIAFESRG